MTEVVEFKEILVASRTELVDKMANLDDMMDHLFQGKFISLDDMERINSKDTRKDKVRELLSIMDSCQEKSLGTKFKSALTKSNMDYLNSHLDERELFVRAKIIIKKTYVEAEAEDDTFDNSTCVKLSDLVTCVKDLIQPQSLLEEMEDSDITDLVEEAIGEVFKSPSLKQDDNGCVFFMNISKVSTEATSAAGIKEIRGRGVQGNDVQHIMEKKVTTWNTLDVQIWLHAQSVHKDIIKDFMNEEIDGNALMDITEQDLKGEEFPHVTTFGRRKDLLRKIQALLRREPHSNQHVQSYLNETTQLSTDNVQPNEPEEFCTGDQLSVEQHREHSVKNTKHEDMEDSGSVHYARAGSSEITKETEKMQQHSQKDVTADVTSHLSRYVDGQNKTLMVEIEGAGPANIDSSQIASQVEIVQKRKQNTQHMYQELGNSGDIQPNKDCINDSHSLHFVQMVEQERTSEEDSVNPEEPKSSPSTDEAEYRFSAPTEYEYGNLQVPECYRQNAQLTVACRMVTDLITPLECAFKVDLGDEKKLPLFTENMLKLISACLNERTNARIYVGVSEDWTIQGTSLYRPYSHYQKLMKHIINRGFSKDVRNVVHSCVRSPKFVEVLTLETCTDKLYILEIDVVATADHCKDKVFSIRLPDKRKSTEGVREFITYKFEKSDVILVSNGRKQEMVEKIIGKNDLRKYHENMYFKKIEQEKEGMLNLTEKLLELLGLNTGKFVDLYPILATNKPSEKMDKTYISENLSFIGNIEMKAVFDFDAEGTVQSFVEKELHKLSKVVSTTDEFDPLSTQNQKNPERLQTLHDEILGSKLPHWIFCNGYEVISTKFPKLSAVQWHKEKKEGFKESVSFFKKQIPYGRAVIIFVLLSQVTKVMTDAIQEFMSAFPEQWLFIAEDKSVVDPLFDELTRRSVEEYDCLQNRSIIGMPFKKVQDTIIQATGFLKIDAATIPCSDGHTIELNEQIRNEFTELEILSANECDHLGDMPREAHDKLKTAEENHFYKGGEVSWRNFWFGNHVLKRTRHKDICDEVKKTAQSGIIGDTYLGRITLYHQPGAGGTTMAKQVLWDCRKMYRCAVVRAKTEQTASQINMLRLYKDKRPMPVLLLLDNLEEEPATVLLAELELLAKQTVRSVEHTDKPKPLCIALICLRRSKMPLYSTEGYRTLLKHELLPKEIDWFKRKFGDLERRFDEKEYPDACQINPKLLISFNIMKQNFNREYIYHMTKEFVNGIKNLNEKKLLKYVALLNAFDLSFKEVPCAAFDNLMVTIPWTPGPRRGRGAAARCWEANLSSEFQVLINETSTTAFTSIKAIRITNPLLSKEILKVLQQSDGKHETISSFALEFLSCKDIFNVTSHAKEALLRLVKDLMKRRGRLPSGNLESKFAPLIQDIVDNESIECSMAVLEKAFVLTKDPYIAQQLARLCIFAQKWESAIKYAKEAITMKPESSFLWDTYGRVYQTQLAEKYYKFSTIPDKKLDIEEVLEVTQLAMDGAEKFRKVQSCSENEYHGLPTNNAGYFGELEITECLLHCLRSAKCFQNNAELTKCLVEKDYYPDALKEVVAESSERGIPLEKLKHIKQCTEEALNKLEDERMQLHDDTIDEYRENSIKQRSKKMEALLTNFDFYFGEHCEKLPSNIDPSSEEAGKRRRRRINTLGGTSSRSIFDLKLKLEGEHKLIEIRELCLKNIETKTFTAMDYQVAIAASITLTAVNPKYVHKCIQFAHIVVLSQRLYEMRQTGKGFIYLEPYLFYVLFNWPRKSVKSHVTPKQLTQALHKWKEAYFKKWPKQSDGNKPTKQKDKTIFFFANGSDMMSVVSYHEIKGFQSRGEIFWREPHILRKLKRFQGVLSDDGDYVSVLVATVEGNQYNIEISTSFPIRDRKMWNKQVYFVIGFSWKGPKAFDVSLNDPTDDVDFLAMDHKVSFTDQDLKNEKPLITLAGIITRLTEVNGKLQYINDLKKKKKRSGVKLHKYDEALVMKEEKIMRDRQGLMWTRLKLVEKMKTTF